MQSSTYTIKNTIDRTARVTKPRLLLNRHSRTWMTMVLMISDLFMLLLSGVFAYSLRIAIQGSQYIEVIRYIQLIPVLVLIIGIYAVRGLYPAVGLSPVEEIKRLSVSTSVIVVMVITFTFWIKSSEAYSRLIFTLFWIIALVSVQSSRWLVRIIAIRLKLWGEPVAIIGYGPNGKEITNFLDEHLQFGIRPEIIIDGFGLDIEPEAQKIFLNHENVETISQTLKKVGITTAILNISEMPAALQQAIIDEGHFGFRRLILISSLGWIGSMGVNPYDFEGILGLEVRQNLLSYGQQLQKRLLDILIVIFGSVIALPIMAIIAIMIKLGSRGPVLYGHIRLGKNGKTITVWKFRTMVQDAETKLQEYLNKHPEYETEWIRYQKLRKDPRVTKIGHLLRQMSLDELPQLWNILIGEMSLVGPRPIIQEEASHYGDRMKLYSKVRPGLTGLWQVSGRNDIGYASRVRMDEYYVRNWSIWLDIYILLRTFWVVVNRRGAY